MVSSVYRPTVERRPRTALGRCYHSPGPASSRQTVGRAEALQTGEPRALSNTGGPRKDRGKDTRRMTATEHCRTSPHLASLSATTSSSQRWRTPGRDRQAGGHWFEPSTAHSRKPLLAQGFPCFSVLKDPESLLC